MFRSLFAAALLISCGAVSAAEIVAMDLNFYSTGPISVKPVGKLPAGVALGKPIKYRNPNLKGLAFPVRIDLGKTKTVNIAFTVSGDGRICPSLTGHVTNARGKRTRQMKFKCTAFEFCDEPSPFKLPRVIEKWTNMMSRGVDVSDGETITVKATFAKAD